VAAAGTRGIHREASPGINGTHVQKTFTEAGLAIADGQDWETTRAAMLFQKSRYTPQFATTYGPRSQGANWTKPFFAAFKAPEVAVRKAGADEATDLGMDLMRKAFESSDTPKDNRGWLTNLPQPSGEREALSHLFAGSLALTKILTRIKPQISTTRPRHSNR
jgi:hypothetical protein